MTGMSNVSSIALSGLSAASLRLQVSANNVANAYSAGPLPGSPASGNYPAPYVPERVDQVDLAGGGTSATINAVSPATVTTYDPTAPYADSNGMVAMPNVDFANEAVQQLMARISFAANVMVLKTDAQMMKSLLDIKV